ncbi:hypothetical protein CWI66_16600 [Halomonas sp. 141]|nr:hypothetical protein CWI66_16600 [Halomonas sp. 141]
MGRRRVCNAFDISHSSYYEYRQRRHRVDVERLALKAQVSRLFKKSRSSAGSRSIKKLLSEEGVTIGRFKVRSLMSEMGLVCKQPGPMLTSRRPLSDLILRIILAANLH